MIEEQLTDRGLTAVGLVIEVRVGLRAKTRALLTDQLDGMFDFDALIRLARSPGRRLRMSDLAAQMSLSRSGTTRVVDRLELRQLVHRQSCPGDGRSSYAVLTDSGAARIAAALPALVETIDRWFTKLLPQIDLDTVLQALRTVRDTVRPGASAGSRGENALPCCRSFPTVN